MRDDRLILLAEADNVLIARARLKAGEDVALDGTRARVDADIGLGHKIARRAIDAGEKVLKYGAPIGSATQAIAAGAHVHVHNMKSDYTATHHLLDAPDRNGETA